MLTSSKARGRGAGGRGELRQHGIMKPKEHQLHMMQNQRLLLLRKALGKPNLTLSNYLQVYLPTDAFIVYSQCSSRKIIRANPTAGGKCLKSEKLKANS